MEAKKTPLWAEDRLDDLLDKIEEIVKNNSRPANEIFLDEKETLAKLKVSKRTLANYRATRQIDFYRKNGIIRYKLSELIEFLESGKVPVKTSSSRLFGGQKNK